MLKIVLDPINEAITWILKKLFNLGEFLGSGFVKVVSGALGLLADLFDVALQGLGGVFDAIGKLPKMEWAEKAAKSIDGLRRELNRAGDQSVVTADKVERSSKRIRKALDVQPVDIRKENSNLDKQISVIEKRLEAGNLSKQDIFALQQRLQEVALNEIKIYEKRDKRLEGLAKRRKDLLATVFADEKMSVGQRDALYATRDAVLKKQEDTLARRASTQVASIQKLFQAGAIGPTEARLRLIELQKLLDKAGLGVKIPTKLDEATFIDTKRKLDEVSKPRTATLTIVERIQSAGKSILDIFKAGAAAKQKSQLEAAIALAQAETTKLQTALGALKTAMRRPAVEAVKGLVAVLMDVPRQLRMAFSVISPQVVQLGAGVGKTLAAGMRSEIQKVSMAGTELGKAAMAGLGAGLSSGFNTIVKPMLKGFTEEIPKLKGPIAYDATLLQPAGTAIMGGFARGLESGFDNVRSWLKAVAPAIEESVPDNLMVERTGKFLVDWLRSGKTLKPEDAFGDLVPKVPDFMGGDIGPIDASLGFLHPTASLRDTTVMAQALAKMFGLTVTDIKRPSGTKTASGNISDHSMGWAADISGSMSNTDRMVAAIKGLFPSVIKQLIWRNKDVNRGFFVGDHMDHAHLAFRPAAGFSLNSGKLGVTPVMPGSGGKAGSSSVMQAIARAAAATGMPVALIKAIAKQESGFNPRAGSPAGAKGLMQLMPGTARGLGVRDIYDPFQNALGGARYIRSMLSMFKRLDYALAGYNAGPGAVRKFGGIPPYRETQNYVRAVMRYFQQFGGAFGGFRAQGGMVSPGSAYVVGERGRELFVPGQRGNVITNANLERLIKLMEEQERKGKKGVTYQNNMTVQSNSSDPRVVASLIDSHNRYSMSRLNL
jgi:SLT domain-containing protein